MQSRLDKFLRHPVISAVVAAAIIAIASTVFGWWGAIWIALKSAGSFVGRDVGVPLWLLAILVTLAFFVVVLPMLALVRNRESHEPWRGYAVDEFYGVRWRWDYYSDGRLKGLVPFCVNCDFQIRPSFASAYHAVDIWEYKCENCGHVGATIEELPEELHDRVTRQVQLKLRRGEWIGTQGTS